MPTNPKNVQQAVKVAVALANPVLLEKDWAQLKERFHLEDGVLKAIRTLIASCKEDPDLKTVLSCLTFGS